MIEKMKKFFKKKERIGSSSIECNSTQQRGTSILYDFNGCSLDGLENAFKTEEEIENFLKSTSKFDSETIRKTTNENVRNILLKILEKYKNPGLNLKNLQENGAGVSCAIIDQPLFEHQEINSDNIHNESVSSNPTHTMHGNAVSSIFVGENIGVAPGAELFFYGPSEMGDWNKYSQSLQNIIEHNRANPDKKIRIVSVSKGCNLEESGAGLWLKTKEQAKKEGIIVLDVDEVGKNFSGASSIGDDLDNPNSYVLSWQYDNTIKLVKDILKILEDNQENPDKVFMEKFGEKYLEKFNAIKSIFSEEKKAFPEEDLVFRILGVMNKKDLLRNGGIEINILFPLDHKTFASPKDGVYTYQSKNGFSWAEPYISGIFAIGLQINPNLTEDDILKAIKETATENKYGFKVLNPEGFVEYLKTNSSN